MRYLDGGGDTWEDATDGYVRVVVVDGVAVDYAEPQDVDVVTEKWGPLTPVDDLDDEGQREPDLPTVESVMSRAAIFQSAHALVSGLKWEDDASVYDVLSVAKWLEGEG